jgi:hypothetical protein
MHTMLSALLAFARAVLAPMTRPIAWERFSRLALTKETISTVVALEDCTTAVMGVEKHPRYIR